MTNKDMPATVHSWTVFASVPFFHCEFQGLNWDFSGLPNKHFYLCMELSANCYLFSLLNTYINDCLQNSKQWGLLEWCIVIFRSKIKSRQTITKFIGYIGFTNIKMFLYIECKNTHCICPLGSQIKQQQGLCWLFFTPTRTVI